MKSVTIALSLLFLNIWQCSKTLLAATAPQSGSRVSPVLAYALADARVEGNKADWKGVDNYLAATRYIQVTLGRRDCIYTREGRFVKARAARFPSAGMMGRYAEVGWDYLDRRMKTFSDTYGHLLLRYSGGRCRLVTSDRGGGYASRADLRKAGVPASVLRRLKLGEPR